MVATLFPSSSPLHLCAFAALFSLPDVVAACGGERRRPVVTEATMPTFEVPPMRIDAGASPSDAGSDASAAARRTPRVHLGKPETSVAYSEDALEKGVSTLLPKL